MLPQESRLGPVQGYDRVWWLSGRLEVSDINNATIMFVETLYFVILWRLQPFRFYRPRFSVDEFQASIAYGVQLGLAVAYRV